MAANNDVSFLSRLVKNLKQRGPDPLRPIIDAESSPQNFLADLDEPQYDTVEKFP